MNDEIKQYIQSQLEAGVSWEKIKSDLLGEGWLEEVVNQAQAALNVSSTKSAAPENPPEVQPAEESSLSAVHQPSSKLPILFAVLGFLVLLIAGMVFAFMAEIGPFKKSLPYSEENLVSGIVASLAQMETFTYSINAKLNVEERDPDAVPFVLVETPEMKERQEKYQRDFERVRAVRDIVSQLKRSDQESIATLSELSENAPSYMRLRITDPLTGEEYLYKPQDDDFELTVQFETKEPIYAIRNSYNFIEDKVEINSESLTVVFTKQSPMSIYMSSRLPKPYFEQLTDAMAYLPPELGFEANLSARTDVSDEKADWEIAFDVEGDIGDLVYKVAGDMTKIEDDFYFRIRNMPSIFLGMFAYEKNTWTRVSSEWLEENNSYRSFGVPTYLIPSEEEEAEYKKNREELGRFMLDAISIADELKILTVKNEPMLLEKNATELYRYDLVVDREKIIPFYERIIIEAEKYDVTRKWNLSNDQALLEYLQSAEFDTVFDYYTNNTNLTLWVNGAGFIEIVEYSIRAVPPDEAVQMADKQARITFSLGFSDINEPVDIAVPEEFKDIEDFITALEPTMGALGMEDARTKGQNASIKQSLAAIRSQAELSYNESGFTYTEVCEEEAIQALLKSSQEGSGGNADEITYNTAPQSGNVACLDDDKWYVVQAPLNELESNTGNYFCVDSGGFAGESKEQITAESQKCP